MKDFKMAICQMTVTDNKDKNINKAYSMIKEAAQNGAKLIALGEMFNCPYDGSYFPKFAESLPDGKTYNMLKACSKELDVYIIGGSIPELHGEVIYNTSCVFDKEGKLIAKHRKMHLFDVELNSGLTFKESSYLGKGNDIVVFDTEYCKIGLAICYDIRFPELSRLLTLKGAEVIVIPAAFNMTTGPAHWEILLRTRALDNQVYMVGASPARDVSASYVAYGNSLVVSPWGDIMSRAKEGEEIIYANLQGSLVKKTRDELPLLKHIRKDIYEIIIK
ncbi:2-oxoglutaramate amidase [Oxobacter pfennigii]|uniref:2-oxoglutaramate amidase n=1 Tax=Oxobacter pfennigii TaxID=36849 RepID=A0A0P8X3E5_9CLOT|nr:carbon-nitrogen hydrolase family protein [Oxobacter pfennigii]KPU45298.1 2-oxoglutaramate amidase [Oxobacter pfennigii]